MAVVMRMPAPMAGVTEAAIQTWLVEVGAAVEAGDAIVELETEKAVVEQGAEAGGTIARLLVDVGDAVPVGTPIAVIAADGDSDDDVEAAMREAGAQASSSEAAPEPTRAPVTAPEPETADAPRVPDAPVEKPASSASAPVAAGDGERRFISPIARRLAREHGLDVATVTGTGAQGRITRRDVERAIAALPAASGEVQQATAPVDDGFDLVKPSAMRRAIARRLTESVTTIPHFRIAAAIDVGRLLALRSEVNAVASVRVSVNDMLIKAMAIAHAAVPDAQSTWHDDGIHRHRSVDIAMAVAIDGGLLTPVLRGVDRLSLVDVATASASLVERARGGRLQQSDLEGGSMSISNLGMLGVSSFDAIVNPPHSGILAVGRAAEEPVARDGRVELATIMHATLSADHRILDGAEAAKWMGAFQAAVEEPLRLLL